MHTNSKQKKQKQIYLLRASCVNVLIIWRECDYWQSYWHFVVAGSSGPYCWITGHTWLFFLLDVVAGSSVVVAGSSGPNCIVSISSMFLLVHPVSLSLLLNNSRNSDSLIPINDGVYRNGPG